VASERVTFNEEWFRQVLGQYPTGVSVVTAMGSDGQPVGLAVGSFTSVSLDPPLVGFLPSKRSDSWPKVREAGRFCVNVLGADQEPICRRFAAKGDAKFAGLSWHPASSGAPIIDGTLAWIDCDLETVHEVGDHYMVTGRVRELAVERPSLPLVFYQGGYGRFAPSSMAARDADLTAQLGLVDRARAGMERTATAARAQCIAAHLIDGNVVLLASAGTPASPGLSVTRIGSRHQAIPPLGMIWMAFAEPEEVERWLGRVESPAERDRYRRMMEKVRERGYSVGLLSPDHMRIEAVLERRRGTSPDVPLSPEERRLIQSLPYDPLGYSLEEAALEVRSFHAPVFAADGHVALVLVLVGFPPVTSLREAQVHLKALLDLAAGVTAVARDDGQTRAVAAAAHGADGNTSS
jgi:flavin reductase (DIM6/NTAB) family NADH-FMN oxidoreductase RutF